MMSMYCVCKKKTGFVFVHWAYGDKLKYHILSHRKSVHVHMEENTWDSGRLVACVYSTYGV